MGRKIYTEKDQRDKNREKNRRDRGQEPRIFQAGPSKDRLYRWSLVHQEIYNLNVPYCKLCGFILNWTGHGGKRYETVYWDHRNGVSDDICPAEWLAANDPNDPVNVAQWIAFDFGMLCHKCNLWLPTDGTKRKKKVKALIKYTKHLFDAE